MTAATTTVQRIKKPVASTVSSLCLPRSGNLLQRKCACGGTPGPTGECEECRKKRLSLQRKASSFQSPGNSSVSPIVHEVLSSPGQPLDNAVRAFFEPHFGHDFSHVRVHLGARASASAQAVNAFGYTVGNQVVFGEGQYQPSNRKGLRLIAHELTHVVQQQFGRSAGLQKQTDGEESGEGTEEEAERISDQIVANETPLSAPRKPKKAKPACTRTILAEGTCADLVAGSKFICCDPDNGIGREGREKDIDGTRCPSQKFTPIFTCDNNCPKALEKGCDDNDNWMAIPGDSFSRKDCGTAWTICANGKQTTGSVRDRSVTKSSFEVSPGIQNALGVSVGSSFLGAVYRPGAKQTTIDKDPCCKS
jgi:hypothetical protein